MPIYSRLRWFFPVILAFFLVACDQEYTYFYYMEHPFVLKKAVANCEANEEKTEAQDMQCEVVMKAADNITKLIEEQQINPEAFGQHVLEMQIKQMELKAEVDEAQSRLQKEQASTTEKTEAQMRLNELQKDYQDQMQQIRISMAVLGLGSPD
jgi:predicted RNase H-like nuclease (RuvC/YqgF family)